MQEVSHWKYFWWIFPSFSSSSNGLSETVQKSDDSSDEKMTIKWNSVFGFIRSKNVWRLFLEMLLCKWQQTISTRPTSKADFEFLVLNEIIAEGARSTWRECEPWCQIRQHVKVIINLKLRQLLHAALVARIYRLSPLKSCYFLHRSSLEAKNTSCFECQMGQRGNLHVNISLATISLPTIIKTVNMSGMM